MQVVQNLTRLLRNMASATGRGRASLSRNVSETVHRLRGDWLDMHGQMSSGGTDRRVAVQKLSSFTMSLPCSVPEKYQLNQRVREINQAILGYAGDPQPVVQNVQVHAVGGVFFFFFFRPRRISLAERCRSMIRS